MHEMLLDFVKGELELEGNGTLKQDSIAHQAQYLRRVDVVLRYHDPTFRAGIPGFSSLGSLWRSLEELSGNPELEATSYLFSLEAFEKSQASKGVVAVSYNAVGMLFHHQVRHQCYPLRFLNSAYIFIGCVLTARVRSMRKRRDSEQRNEHTNTVCLFLSIPANHSKRDDIDYITWRIFRPMQTSFLLSQHGESTFFFRTLSVDLSTALKLAYPCPLIPCIASPRFRESTPRLSLPSSEVWRLRRRNTKVRII